MVAWCYLWAVCDPEIGGLGLKTLGDAGERDGFERLQGIFSKCELCLKCETRHGVVTGAVGGWNDGITVTGLSRHGVARLGRHAQLRPSTWIHTSLPSTRLQGQ